MKNKVWTKTTKFVTCLGLALMVAGLFFVARPYASTTTTVTWTSQSEFTSNNAANSNYAGATTQTNLDTTSTPGSTKLGSAASVAWSAFRIVATTTQVKNPKGVAKNGTSRIFYENISYDGYGNPIDSALLYRQSGNNGVTWGAQAYAGGTQKNFLEWGSTDVAIDSSGTVHYVWVGSDGKVYYTKFDGTTWLKANGTAGADNLTTSAAAHAPRIAVDSSGYAHVVWQDNISGNGDIFYAGWNGSAWSTAAAILNNGGASTDPVIVMGTDNYPRVVWTDQSVGAGDIYFAKWNGTAWKAADGTSAPSYIVTSAGLSYLHSMALDSSDNPYIVWRDDTAGSGDIYFAKWTGAAWTAADGTSAPTYIATTAGVSKDPVIAIGTDNRPQVAWIEGYNIAYSKNRAADNVWAQANGTTTSPAYDTITVTSQSTYSLRMILDSNDRPHLAWMKDTNITTASNASPSYNKWSGTAWVRADGLTATDLFSQSYPGQDASDATGPSRTNLNLFVDSTFSQLGVTWDNPWNFYYRTAYMGTYAAPAVIGGTGASVGLRAYTNSTDVRAQWTSLAWTSAALPANTAIKFRVRGSNTTDFSAATWYGPSGAVSNIDDWSSNYFGSATAGNTGATQNISTAMTATSYIDIMARLEGGVNTPQLDSATLTYETLDAISALQLGQYKTDGTTAISVGGGTSESSVILRASTLTGISAFTNPKAEFELKTTNTAFNASSLSTGSVAAEGGNSSVTAAISNGLLYYWRARLTADSGAQSLWTSFGGNSDVVTAATDVTSDTTAPTAPTAATIAAGTGWTADYISNTNKAAVMVSGIKSTDTTQIKIDLDDEDTFTNPKTTTLSGLGTGTTYADGTGIDVTTVTALADGNIALKITAYDAAGNTATQTISVLAGTIKKDTSVPAAPTAGSISVAQNAAGTEDQLSGTAGAVEGSSTVKVYQESGLTTLLGSTTAAADGSFAAFNIGDNQVTADLVYVVAVDAAGNVSSSISKANDTTVPAAPIGASITPSAVTNSDSFTIDWTNPSDASGFSGGASAYYYKVGSAPTASGQGTALNKGTATTLAGLSQGANTIHIWLKDAAGNEGWANATTVTASYDSVGPNAPTGVTFTPVGGTVTAGYLNNSNTGFTVTFTSPATEYAGVAHLYAGGSLLSTDVTTTVIAASTLYTLTGNAQSITDLGADGTKSLTVKIIDTATNVGSASTGVNVVKDVAAPVGGAISYSNAAISYTIGGVVTLTNGTDVTSGIASRVVTRAEKTYASDAVSGSFVDGDFTTTVATDPVSSPITDATVTAGEAYQYRYVVTDSAGNSTTYTSSDTVKFFGATASYVLTTGDDNIIAGNLAQYSVARKDVSTNSVTLGAETVSLSSDSTGANKEFRAPTANDPAVVSVDIADGTSASTFFYYDDLKGTYTITASRTGVTSGTDSLGVSHAAPDHMKFATSISTPRTAGALFNLPVLQAVDQFSNILDSLHGATAYEGSKTIAYALSGTVNSPNGSYTDSWTQTVTFAEGVSTTTLATNLYRAQTTTVTPRENMTTGKVMPDSPTVPNVASNSVVFNPELADSLTFNPTYGGQQPSGTTIINNAMAQQPIIIISDIYGNKTHDTSAVTLYDSTSNSTYLDGSGTLSATANPVNAVDGTVTFAGVKYDTPATIYIYAETAGIVPAYSDAATFTVAPSSRVDAATTPVANFNISPINDTAAEKFPVLKFKVTDIGGDSVPLLVDRIQIAVAGTGNNASTDIVYAELTDGTNTIAAASITNTLITFGGTPNGNSAADMDAASSMDSVADNTSKEYTVNIYMKPSKLTAIDGNTYTFGINESSISIDSGLSSQLGADSSAVATVTGTIAVASTHVEILTTTDASSISVNAGDSTNIKLQAVDANKNIDRDYTGNHTFKFSGLASVGAYNPQAYGANFGLNRTVNFTTGVSATGALIGYKQETGAVSVADQVETSYIAFPMTADVASGTASLISVSSGNDQSGAVGGTLASAIVALISDTYGNPAQDVAVTFAVSAPPGSTGHSLSATSVTTAANGLASTNLTLGSVAGTHTVTATSAGLTGSPLSFTATALSAGAMNIVSGNNQVDKKVAEALVPFIVEVLTSGGAGVPNVTVTFALTSSPSGATGQALSSSSVLTDSSGRAQTTLTLGNKIGDYTVRASYGGFTQDFTATALPEVPYKVVLTGPTSIVAGQPSTVYTIAIQDQYSNNSPVNADTVLALSDDPSTTGAFYSDSGAVNVIATNQRTISSGSSTVTFYYKDTVTGARTMDAARVSGQTGLTVTSANQAVTVVPAGIDHFAITGATTTLDAGGTRAITVTAYDTEGNVKTDYAGSISMIFSGANPSPSPSASSPTVNGTALGTATVLDFASGAATATLGVYKAETVTLKATAGVTTTPDLNALSFVVRHAAVDHLKFGANLPTPQAVGVAFALETTIDAVDIYDNICDGANGATAYNNASKSITYTLSGTSNGPESGTDAFTTPVAFVSGSTTTTISATLYRAQSTTITPSTVGITGTNIASNSITVNPGAVDHLRFSVEPSATGTTNVALSTQPTVAVADQYGNPVTSASGQITLRSSTTSGSYTATTNGTLSATALTKVLTTGVAAFANVKYTYPEAIYLEASALGGSIGGVPLSAIYFAVTLATAEDTTIAGVAQSGTISSLATASASAGAVLAMTITDAGADDYDTKIKQFVINNTNATTTVNWTDFISAATLTDGTTENAAYSIANNKITFGSGASVLYTVTDGTAKTFTLKIVLKAPLPSGADGEVLNLSCDVDAGDITLDAVGSKFTTASSAVTDSSTITVVATDFKLTPAASTMNAGGTLVVTMNAVDVNLNIDETYTGDHSIVFSGASVSSTGNTPTVTVGSTANFAATYGASTPTVVVPFASGVNSSAVTLTLYKAENATVKAYEPSSTIGTSAANDFTVVVSGGSAYQLIWDTVALTKVVANAPWNEFIVAVADLYGNTAGSNPDVTIAIAGGSLGATCTPTVTASAGKAHFTNFTATAATYPSTVTISATAVGISVGTGNSELVTIDEKYSITLNVKDSVTNSALPEVTPQVLEGSTVTYAPGIGNSPFTFQLPYGSYTVSLDKEKYVQSNSSKTAGVSDDASDGTVDNAITWLIYMTSLEESTADYQVKSSFVYDEDLDKLTARLWLERRGKLVLNAADSINKLGTAQVIIFDETANDWMTSLDIARPSLTDYTNGVYKVEVANVTQAGGTIQLLPGKTYFAKCGIYYGGADGTGKLYETGATFLITQEQSIKKVTDQIAGLSTQISTDVAGVKTTVAAEGVATRTKVTEVKTETAKILTATESTIPDKITSESTKVTTKLTTIEKSEILNRESLVMLGTTIIIRYRTYASASPTITVYDPDNVVRVAAAPMTEATAGIYQYAVTFASGWPRGDYSIVCSEATYGTLDAITITAKSTDIENVSSDINAVLGSVTPVRDIKSKVDAFSSAFSIIEDNIQRAAEALAGVQAGSAEAEAAAGQLDGVFNNLKEMSAKIREMGATIGYDLEKMYDLSEARSNDIGYIRNKTQELKALLLLSQQMMEGAAKEEPVVQTWFEFR